MSFIKSKMNLLFKNEFLKNVATLFSGALAAQALPILCTPLLTRVYSVSSFAIYTLFVSIINITSQAACLRYDYAIVVADDDDEATSVFLLASFFTVIFSLFTAILCIPFSHQIAGFFQISSSWGAVLFVPLTTLVCGMTSVLNYYNVRFKRYKTISSANVIKSVVQVVFQLGLGYLYGGYWGLIVGQFFSYFFGNTQMLRTLKGKVKRKMLTVDNLLFCAKKHKDFPKYTLASSMANVVAYNVLPVAMNFSFSSLYVGYYGMMNRVLGLPLSLISGQVSQVFIKQVKDEQNDGERLAKTFNKVSKFLLWFSIIPFALLFIFAEPVIPFVLGEEWATAAKYFKYLIPLFAVRFVVTPISSCALVMKKQKETMYWQFFLLICMLIPSFITIFISVSFGIYLSILSVFVSGAYLVFYKYCYNLIKNNKTN
ncbi:MAG: polysaccharide biosynthesis protein [Oscillospiraceae bacterium]|jgi:O-antigen/teichoic acid export membrane protein|nr:polysaccharide biosynthesis protein [Oscillospiraceae bacterium]